MTLNERKLTLEVYTPMFHFHDFLGGRVSNNPTNQQIPIASTSPSFKGSLFVTSDVS